MKLWRTRAGRRSALASYEQELVPCYNCDGFQHDHVDGRVCLFAPAVYRRMTDEEMDARHPGKLYCRVSARDESETYTITWRPE